MKLRGIYMHKKLQEPFLIIKTSLGGSSLILDWHKRSTGRDYAANEDPAA